MTEKPLPAIIVDTQEKRPFTFEKYPELIIKSAKLKTGDYSVEGLEDRVVVERKSKEDAYGCVGSDRDRFERCLARMSKFHRAVIVIECSFEEFAITPAYVERIDAQTAIHSFISWHCQYGVAPVWPGSRAWAERYTVRFLGSYVKHMIEGKR